MNFSSINLVGVLAATVAAFIVGFLWFGPRTFYPVWQRALGKDPNVRPEGGTGAGLMFGSLLASLVLEVVILDAILIGLYEKPSVVQGLGVGVFAGIGLAAVPSLGHRLFAQQGFKVWAIEVGADIVAAGVIGAVLAAVG